MPPTPAPAVALERFSHRVEAVERYWTELILIAASVWVGASFATGPADFAILYGDYYDLLERIHTSARFWGAFALVAALSKTMGLVLCLGFHRYRVSLAIRCLGLGMSGFFWTVAGISCLMVNPRTVGGALMALTGMSAWRVLVRFPSMPQVRGPE